jgi:hypothetical protein
VTTAHELAAAVGVAVGETVVKHGATDEDAASVLLVLAVGLYSASGYTAEGIREVFEGALRLGPSVMAMAIQQGRTQAGQG